MSKKLLAPILFLVMFIGLGIMPVNAADPDCPGDISSRPCAEDQDIKVTIPNPFSGGDSLFELLQTVINKIILPIGGILAVLAFIYSGFLYVTAQGNPNKISKANTSLLFTAIGTAVLLGAWVISDVICGTINQLGGPSCLG